jgi:hypothetical protein
MAANLKAKISLDTSSFTRGISVVRGQVASLSGTVATAAARISTGLVGALGATTTAFAFGIKNALDFGSSLTELAARTGAPIKDLVIMQQAFKDAGLGAEMVGPAINLMQKAMSGVNEEGEPTNKMFEKLGINLAELQSLKPQSQFEAISKAIANLASPAERSAAAMAIFGRSGGQLLAIFKDPAAMGNAAQAVGSQADILQRSAERFDAVSDRLNAVGTKLRGFFVGVAEAILPKLEAVTNLMAGLDLAGMGQRFGAALSSGLNILVNAFKEGKMGELAGLSLKVGLGKAANFFISAIQFGMTNLAKIMERLFSRDFFEGISAGFKGVTYGFSGFLIEAFNTPITYLQTAMENVAVFFADSIVKNMVPVLKMFNVSVGDWTGVKNTKENFKERYEKNKATNKGFAEWLMPNAGKAFGEMKQKLGPVFEDVANLLEKNFKKFKSSDFIKTSGWEAQLKALATKLNKPIEEVTSTANKLLAGPNGSAALADTSKGNAPDKIETDQWARLGLFVGGGSTNSSLSFARKTAENTSITNKLLGKLVSRPTLSGGAAVWGE